MPLTACSLSLQHVSLSGVILCLCLYLSPLAFPPNPRIPSVSSTASFSERVRNMSPDEIKIPPEPPGRCSNHLQVSEGRAAHMDEMAWVTLSGWAMTFRGHAGEKDQVKLPDGQKPAVLDTSCKPDLRHWQPLPHLSCAALLGPWSVLTEVLRLQPH